jgi:hypothetical protein
MLYRRIGEVVVVTLTLLALHGDDSPTSRSGRFTPDERATGTNSWVPEPVYEGVYKSFRTGHLERGEVQTAQPSATRCSCIAILWLSLVSSAVIILCVACCKRNFVIDSVRKLSDTPSYMQRQRVKSLTLTGIKPPVVQLVASHFTDWATRTPVCSNERQSQCGM